MKILQVNKLYSPWRGGVEKVVEDISEGLVLKGYEVTVLACQPKGPRANEKINGVRVIRAGSFGMLQGMPISLEFFSLFRKLSEEADIIHIHHPFPLATLVWLLLKPKAYLVISYHSDILRQRLAGFFFRPLLRKFLDEAKVIIVSSPNLQEDSLFLKPHRQKTAIIPFGIDLEHFRLTPEIEKQERVIKQKFGSPLILFVGRFVYYKGLEVLLRAVPRLDAALLLVGSGPLETKLRALAKELGASEKIHIISEVSDEDLPAYYHAADIFVLPSTEKTEAFGLVQLEAMACGKPVISTNLPTGVSFVNQHEKTGLLVPPGDIAALQAALGKLLRDANLRKLYGENAFQRSQGFSLEKEINEIEKLYQSVLEEKRSRQEPLP